MAKKRGKDKNIDIVSHLVAEVKFLREELREQRKLFSEFIDKFGQKHYIDSETPSPNTLDVRDISPGQETPNHDTSVENLNPNCESQRCASPTQNSWQPQIANENPYSVLAESDCGRSEFVTVSQWDASEEQNGVQEGLKERNVLIVSDSIFKRMDKRELHSKVENG